MHTHALGDFAYRLVLIVAVARDVLSSARNLAFASTNSQKSPALGTAFVYRLCLLRQKAGDQGREANGRSDDVHLHDELLYLGLLSSRGGDLRDEALAARVLKAHASLDDVLHRHYLLSMAMDECRLLLQ